MITVVGTDRIKGEMPLNINKRIVAIKNNNQPVYFTTEEYNSEQVQLAKRLGFIKVLEQSLEAASVTNHTDDDSEFKIELKNISPNDLTMEIFKNPIPKNSSVFVTKEMMKHPAIQAAKRNGFLREVGSNNVQQPEEDFLNLSDILARTKTGRNISMQSSLDIETNEEIGTPTQVVESPSRKMASNYIDDPSPPPVKEDNSPSTQAVQWHPGTENQIKKIELQKIHEVKFVDQSIPEEPKTSGNSEILDL